MLPTLGVMYDLHHLVLYNRAEGDGENTLTLTQNSLTLIEIQRVKKDDIPFESPTRNTK